jgi:hypothetical protein
MKKMAFLLIFFLPYASHARDLSYSYIEIGAASTETEVLGIEIEGDAKSVFASAEIGDKAYIHAAYGNTEFDFDIETNLFSAGLGLHTDISEGTDIFVEVSFVSSEVEQPSFGSEDDTGTGVDIGIRHLVSDSLELNAGFAQVSIFDESETAFGVGARLYANESISVGIEYATADDTDGVGFSLRAEF